MITDKSGEILEAKHNQLLYMAKGIEYKVEFKDTDHDKEDTIVIHFQMTTPDGEDIMPVEKPIICIKNLSVDFGILIDHMAEEFENNIVCLPDLKASLYKLLAEICQKQKRRSRRNKFVCIREGIKLLEQNTDMKISEIAKICGVSECYFRRLFKEYSGESPMDFRQHYRIKKAKQLLLFDESFNIGEIAEELNFADIYHFSKTFKLYNGVSPKQFLQGVTTSLDEETD